MRAEKYQMLSVRFTSMEYVHIECRKDHILIFLYVFSTFCLSHAYANDRIMFRLNVTSGEQDRRHNKESVLSLSANFFPPRFPPNFPTILYC